MTPQEQQMIQGLITRIVGTSLADKDPEAEQFLQQSLGRNPDALYILAQTVLVQTYGLEQAQKQLADAKAQLQQALARQQQAPAAPQKHTSFLGSIFGSGEAERPAPPPPPSPPQYAPVPAYQQQTSQYAPVQYASAPAFGGGGGGFLRGAMQTAAGVAAGAVAFEGIESLMHGFGGHGGGFGGSGFGGFGNDAPREEVINNYYGDSDSGGREHSTHEDGGRGFLGNDDASRTDPADVNDQDNSAGFAETGSDPADDSNFDISSDDSSSDDTSFDSGGSDDSSFS